ncbi:Putative nuclease HARBI1 [Eumeta japonica]|uniref:Nuclease HARBI1 n=1 Tax=Eumeta variegata TaxID=151549 RepID=A0A4C1YZ71_EUMVA|nr:Putative nuclease HARBI1 [Eumeta japonica]
MINFATTRKWVKWVSLTLTEHRREITASAFAFDSESESSGGLQPLHDPIPPRSDILFLIKRPATLRSGFCFTTLTAEPITLLPYLLKRFVSAGGVIKEATIHSFKDKLLDEFDIIVNCTGLSAKFLVPDPAVCPIRGQVVRAILSLVAIYRWEADSLLKIAICMELTVDASLYEYYLSVSVRNYGISPLHQLLLTLRFYALGTMLVAVGDYIGVSKSAASRIVREVSKAIARLYPKYIYVHSDTTVDFYNIARFPRVLGAIDGTHILMQSPNSNIGEEFRNRKSVFSMNVQGVCDANLYFLNVVARWPGSTHDATIFNNSELRAQCENGVYGNRWLIGDSAYPCKPYLLTPLLTPVSQNEINYNRAHIKTRNTIESTKKVGVKAKLLFIFPVTCLISSRATKETFISGENDLEEREEIDVPSSKKKAIPYKMVWK